MNGKVGYPPLNPFYAENFVHEGRKIILQIHNYVFSTKKQVLFGQTTHIQPLLEENFRGDAGKEQKNCL